MLLHIRAGEVPHLIRKTAKEIAGAFYDDPRSERFRKTAPRERQFVDKYWPNHVEHAVEALTMVLAQNQFPDAEKDRIAQAIIDYRNRSMPNKPGLSFRVFH